MRHNNLKKYDAPLRLQFQWGYTAFKKGYITTNIDPKTMQYREWQRGWDTAYFDNLKGLNRNELARG